MDVPAPLPDPLVELIAHRFRVLGEPARIKLLDALHPDRPPSASWPTGWA